MDKRYYLGKHNNHDCFITWDLHNDHKGVCFSMQAEEWKSNKRGIIQGGQCVDIIASYFPNDTKAQRMVEIWKQYHLNYMQAGCEHQRAEKWEEVRIPASEMPAKHRANKFGNGDYMAIWIWPYEHPNGLLTKPCSVCGYEYGSAWLYMPIPDEIVAEIKSWSERG